MAEKKGRLGGRLIKFSAILAVLGIVVAAIVVKGFEQADVKLNTQNLWILHKDEIKKSAYYGQVNTGLSELTSVNSVARKPGAILQSAFGATLLEVGNVTMADIDLASPTDFAKDSRAFETLIDSTTATISRNLIAFFGATKGTVSYTKIVEGQTPLPQSIGKPASIGNGVFAAATVSEAGLIYAFSPQTSRVYSYDTTENQWVGEGDEASGAAEGDYQLTAIGEKWVLLDQTAGRVWVRGVGGSKTFEASTTAKLQTPSPESATAYFSTNEAVLSINLTGGDVKEVQRASGVNSAPTWFEGNVYAAWLNSGDGVVFNSSNDELLQLSGFAGGKSLSETQDPVIQTNEFAAVVNDAQSGWAWNVSDGLVIPSTQDWNSKIIPPPPVVDGGEDAKKQEPPVANDDSFGARPDTLTTLPVLLNDTDPNPEDVLTIDPKSVSGWDETKGTLRISADGQSFSLLPKKTVKGSAAFSYKVSDGSQANGTLSKAAATVTIRFVQSGNTAPVWCSDAPNPCAERPAPSANVLPGQSVSVEFANGFIDPEGDKVFISAASVTSGTGSAGFTSKGEVVFRSTLSKTATETAKVAVTVSDTFGASTTKTLSIKVNPNTELGFTPFVVTTIVGQTKVVDILRGITGSVGQVTLVQASRGNNNFPIVSPTAFSVTSSVAEQLQVAIKFSDENGVPKNSYVQVNVIDDRLARVAVSPVTVLVRAGLDSTVDLYTAISNPSERSLIITLDTKIDYSPGATLSVGKVKGGNVRLRGETEDQAPGKVATVRFTVSDGTDDPNYTAEGQIFVYQVASATAAPIGVDDSITLRAETTGDLDALANDVGTPGISLAIDAKEVTCKGTGFDEAGGLAFASQGLLRIVAPVEPGFYLCNYSIYSSDQPTLKSTANFGVNVTTKSSNKAPIAPTIRARVTSFATVEIPIPLRGIDPDGDTVSITGVGQSSAGKGFAAVSAKGNSVFYTVIPGQEGQDSFTYTVSDGDLSSTGVVKVGIFAKYSDGPPVTMVDVIDLVAGSDGKAEFDPTANDFDPSGKGLTLIPGSVIPNLKAGTDAYNKSAALISEPAKNSESRAVTVSAANEVTELEYVYRVSGAGGQSIGAILVRVTSKAVPDQPQVLDTYVDAQERELLATSGVDVRTNKVTWLTGNPATLKLTIVGNARGFTVRGQSTLVGSPPATSTFVVFKLSGKDFANKDAFTYGILHIPAESKVINLRDVNQVWELNEGATDDEDLLDWIAIPTGARVEIDGANVKTSGNGRPEGACTFKSGTTVSYSAGNGGTKFNDVCVVPIRYVGEQSYTLLPLRIRVIANNPEPVFNNVTIEVMPGSTSEVDLKSMVSWDEASPSFSWKVQRDSGSSITEQGPNGDLMTFSVVPGSEAREESKYSVRIGSYQSFGVITVIVGESPNAKPSATLTFDNKNCDFTSKTCSLTVNDLTGVVNAFPQPLKFMPFGYSKGTPNYKTGQLLVCKDVKIKVIDANTITATWKATTSQSCPSQIGSGALLDAEGKKGSLQVAVDLQGVPQAPLSVEQIAFSRSTVTLRVKAGDFSETEFRVREYVIREGNQIVTTCTREGNEAVTTCPVIEDLRPYRGNGDKENLHTYTVTARNQVGESTSITGSGIYAYERLKEITPDVIEAETVLGRETATDMGVLQVTLSPRPDPLAAKYVIIGEGGTAAKTEVISGDYKTRTFLLSAKPGNATVVTVRAEGAIPAPVSGAKGSSTTTWSGVVSGAPKIGLASASILGDTAPYFGKVTLNNANRNYSKRTAKVAYVFWSGVRSPVCTFDEPTNSLTVEQLAGVVVKYADDRAFNDQVVDLVSSDIAGIQQNTSYRAKACYSNGFKMSETLAPNTLSTISAPGAEDFKYKVELVSNVQSTGQYLFTWAVKVAQSPSIPAGMKAQYSSTKSATEKWQDAIYSEYWNERPIIKVRYCNLSATICSGPTDVKPESDSASWQVRVQRAFLATADSNATERPTCSPTRPLDLNFGVVGDNVTGWLGARPDEIDSGQFLAEYQLAGSTAWVALDDTRSFFRARTGVGTITKLRFWLKPNGGTTSALEKVQVTIDVTC